MVSWADTIKNLHDVPKKGIDKNFYSDTFTA